MRNPVTASAKNAQRDFIPGFTREIKLRVIVYADKDNLGIP
jgi:hypothetical protein